MDVLIYAWERKKRRQVSYTREYTVKYTGINQPSIHKKKELQSKQNNPALTHFLPFLPFYQNKSIKMLCISFILYHYLPFFLRIRLNKDQIKSRE